MKLIIDSRSAVTGSSLSLKISGFDIEVSEPSCSGKIAISEDFGNVSIELISIVEAKLMPEEISVSQDIQETDQEVPFIEDSSEALDISPDLLFQKLVALRRDIAKEAKLPPYIIFHDKTLKEMVSKLPVDLEEMKEVSGVGNARLEKYGSKFVELIKEHLAISA